MRDELGKAKLLDMRNFARITLLASAGSPFAGDIVLQLRRNLAFKIRFEAAYFGFFMNYGAVAQDSSKL